MNKQIWPAIILIMIGILLILYQTDLLDFSTADLISYGFVLIGIIFLIKCLNQTDRRGILGGVFFTLFGLTMILMREHTLPRDDEFGFAAFFLALALANIAYLPFKKDKSTNIIWGMIFGVVGGLLLWVHYGYFPSWYIYEQFTVYWPVILIVLGSVMIVKAYIRHRHTSDKVELQVK
jgi:Na+/proline symporter